MAALRSAVAAFVRQDGYHRSEEPFQLTSGGTSYDYIDGKRAIASGPALRLSCEAIIDCTLNEQFNAVGGPTMGADPLAHGIAILQAISWFSVLKKPKGHGTKKLITGADLGPGDRVLVVDDTVTTGGSLCRAIDAIEATGAKITLVVALVDRGHMTAEVMKKRGLTYRSVITFADLGIAAVN